MLGGSAPKPPCCWLRPARLGSCGARQPSAAMRWWPLRGHDLHKSFIRFFFIQYPAAEVILLRKIPRWRCSSFASSRIGGPSAHPILSEIKLRFINSHCICEANAEAEGLPRPKAWSQIEDLAGLCLPLRGRHNGLRPLAEGQRPGHPKDGRCWPKASPARRAGGRDLSLPLQCEALRLGEAQPMAEGH